MLKQIDLLRHGEPVGGRRYRGQMDDPLSDRGWEEMRTTVQGYDDNWDAIVHSPLSRCADFAGELSGKLGIPKLADERLKEIGFGAWEGQTGDDIRAVDPDALKQFYLDPVNNQPEGAERLRAFYLRVTGAWDDIVAHTEHERILFIVHAGVMRAIVTHVLKAPLLSMYRMQIPSAGMMSIGFSEERPPTLKF
ncbi:MAG: histidine phosphatase family protein [Gammaproteobacteria bacterium]|nr:histidine phosphatase family protein [Gammaproteobacteria bacterium]